MPCARLSPRDGAQSRFDFERSTVNANEYLRNFFSELERLVDGHGTRHAISTASTGQLEVRLGAGDWYWVHRLRSMTIRSGRHKPLPGRKKYFPTII